MSYTECNPNEEAQVLQVLLAEHMLYEDSDDDTTSEHQHAHISDGDDQYNHRGNNVDKTRAPPDNSESTGSALETGTHLADAF